MKITVDGRELVFQKIGLCFEAGTYENIFSDKNNKTVAETLNAKRYKNLKGLVEKNYSEFIHDNLGDFLKSLKQRKDSNYKLFLNRHGDMKYCVFAINSGVARRKGLYFYEISGQIKYIGRCLDNFKKRINWGYGRIHPKNCFLDGQSTNCHLNSLITENKDKVNLWVCLLSDNNEIKVLEKKLIGKYNPEWNLQLLKKNFSTSSRPD